MQPFALVDRDFTADIQLGLAPHRPLKTFAIKFAPGDLFHDNVRNFMKKHSIPAYLELSILSTVGTLYERSVQKHREDRLGHDADLDLQAMKEGRRAFIDCYEEHTQEFHNSSAQDTFATAYYTLVHSPIPSIFDTILELEQNYALSISQLIQARDNEIKNIKDRHEREVGDSISARPTYLITQQVEELEVCQATWASDIHETQITQKREYRDFIVQLYQEYQTRVAQSQQGNLQNGVNHSKPSDIIDGKEIVSATINRMKTNTKPTVSSESDEQHQGDNDSQDQATESSSLSRSRRGSSSSSLLKYASENLENREDGDKKASPSLNLPDPSLQRMVKSIEQMGFPKEQAECALGMTNCNVEQAIVLLLEQPEKVEAALTSAAASERLVQKSTSNRAGSKRLSVNKPTRPSAQGHHRSESGNPSSPRQSTFQRSVTTPASISDTLNKNARSWSPITFLQQQKQAMENTNVSSVRRLGGWLGKAMENLGLEDNGNPYATSSSHMHTSQLVESFTITLGTAQTRATHNLRLLVTDENSEIFCPDIQDTGRELAYRAQNANNLYSDQLSAIVVLVDIKEVQIERSTLNDKPFNRGWTRYRNGQGSNQALFSRCHQSTEFHFPDIDSQLQTIENDYVDNQKTVEEGDFFITRHSNLPLTQIVFHLVIDGDAISRVELTSRHPILSGLRNILRFTTRYEIGSLSLPLLLLPNYFLEQPEQYFFSTILGAKPSQGSTWLYKRGEVVMKCVKGFLIESSRLGKAGPIERCFNFLLPKNTQIFSTHSGASVGDSLGDIRNGQQQQPHVDLEIAFQQFRGMLVELFRAT